MCDEGEQLSLLHPSCAVGQFTSSCTDFKLIVSIQATGMCLYIVVQSQFRSLQFSLSVSLSSGENILWRHYFNTQFAVNYPLARIS